MNIIAKAFVFPNILFIGIPMLMLSFIMGSVITTGRSMSISFPTAYYAVTFYVYGVFIYHTFHALNTDDYDKVKDSGIAGVICSLSTVIIQRLHSKQYRKYTEDMVLMVSVFLLIGVSVYTLIDNMAVQVKTVKAEKA